MKKVLLDTNCYTGYLKGDKKILDVLVNAEIVYMSIFVLGELFAGFKGGNKEQKNIQDLKRFLKNPTVIVTNTTIDTAEIFAEVKNNLKKSGNPIPINDVWIASQAIENGAFVITYDSHFLNVPNILSWEELK